MNPSKVLDLVDRLDAAGWALSVEIKCGRVVRVVATWDEPDRRPEQVAADYERMRERRG